MSHSSREVYFDQPPSVRISPATCYRAWYGKWISMGTRYRYGLAENFKRG